MVNCYTRIAYCVRVSACAGSMNSVCCVVVDNIFRDSKFAAMTRDQLNCKREEFWDTRVEGRAEVWQSIRMTCDPSLDEETCHAIF